MGSAIIQEGAHPLHLLGARTRAFDATLPSVSWSHLQSTCAAAQEHSPARAQSVPLFSQAHCHRVCCAGQQASSGSFPWQASLAAGASAGDAHASMAGSGFRRQAAAAAAGLILVLLSLEGGAAQTTPALNLTVAQPNGIANVSLVTATALLTVNSVGVANQNIVFSTVGNTGALSTQSGHTN